MEGGVGGGWRVGWGWRWLEGGVGGGWRVAVRGGWRVGLEVVGGWGWRWLDCGVGVVGGWRGLEVVGG